jgi:hypothetical protein
MVIGQRDHAGAELDALGALAGGGQKHLGRGDHLPAAGMMLAAPELVVARSVEMLDELEVAAELQGGIFADRMMRARERAEAHASHVDAPISPQTGNMPAGGVDTRRGNGGAEGEGCAGDGRSRGIGRAIAVSLADAARPWR